MTIRIKINLDYAKEPAANYKYQHYFIEGFKQLQQVDFKFSSPVDHFLADRFDKKKKGTSFFWNKLWTLNKRNIRAERSTHVGRYLFYFDGASKPIKIAIDCSDHRHVRDPHACKWSDIYFKTNKWPSFSYPDKVLPLMNANGILTPQDIDYIRSLRSRSPNTDLIYWTKLWGTYQDRQTCRNIIEHQLRIFESLAKINCEKKLLAIVPKKDPLGYLQNCLDRLDKAGVAWQHDWGDIDSKTFWDNLATARCVFLRPGNHLCISWRMTDLLCMGACVIYDGAPYPQWHLPLLSGVHYVDGGCRIIPDYSIPSYGNYKKLVKVIEDLLSNDGKINQIKQNNRTFFDNYALPSKLASYILNEARRSIDK